MAGNLLCSPSTLFRHIGLLFGERLDTLFTSVGLKNIRIHPSTRLISDSLRIYFFPLWPRPHVIGFVADLIFSTLESGFIFFRIRCRIRRIRVDGSRIRKEKVADSKISGYLWTGPKCFSCRINLAVYCLYTFF